jgi:VanZ family protein
MLTAGKWLSLLSLAAVLSCLLHFGLRPYDFGRRNQVRWGETGHGLVFGDGIAFSDGPLYWKAAEQPRELSVEAWVVPYPRIGGVRTILGLVDDASVAPFEISVSEGSIALRYRVRERAGGDESRAVSFEQGLRNDQLVHLAVTSGAKGTRLYVDGSAPDVLRMRQPLLPAGTAFAARLVLGNSAQAVSAWSGEFRGLAVFDRVLEEQEIRDHGSRVQGSGGIRGLVGEPWLRALYAFDEASGQRVQNLIRSGSPIQIPRQLHALRWGVLEFPARQAPWSRSAILDMLINWIGFVPFGLLAAHLIHVVYGHSLRTAFLNASLASAAVSLAIELAQALLPSRHSSALDLLLNVGGGVAGAALLCALRRSRASPG